MAKSSGKDKKSKEPQGSALARILIILYGLGIVLIAIHPHLGQLESLYNSAKRGSKKLSIRKGVDSGLSASSASSSAIDLPRKRAASAHEKALHDEITNEDRAELNNLLESL